MHSPLPYPTSKEYQVSNSRTGEALVHLSSLLLSTHLTDKDRSPAKATRKFWPLLPVEESTAKELGQAGEEKGLAESTLMSILTCVTVEAAERGRMR